MDVFGSDYEQLHVTIVSSQKNWHGGEMQAALLAEGLVSRGHRCSIVCRAGSEFARRMRDRDFEVLTFAGGARSPVGLLGIRRALKALRPHVLHANDTHALAGCGFASFGRQTPLRAASRRVDFPLRITKHYKRFSDGLICVSSAVMQVCRQAGLEPQTLHIVHDGVDPAHAESGSRARGRRSLGATSATRLLVTVAKLTDHKGHTFLLQAMPCLLAQNPKIRLALAGDGELREELRQQACTLGIQHAVQFLGYRSDVPDLLAAADVVVQPSHLEGLCSSLIDAMLAARPIVATTAGGIPDLLDTMPGELPVAWQVPPKSPAALAMAILSALDEQEEAVARGQAARQRALRCFTADHMVDGTLRAYAAMAGRRYADQAASRVPGLGSWESTPASLAAA